MGKLYEDIKNKKPEEAIFLEFNYPGLGVWELEHNADEYETVEDALRNFTITSEEIGDGEAIFYGFLTETVETVDGQEVAIKIFGEIQVFFD